LATATAIGQGRATHGIGLVAPAGRLSKPALNTSVLICAFDEKVRELSPHCQVAPALMACEPVM
jgi:hypothetical protein